MTPARRSSRTKKEPSSPVLEQKPVIMATESDDKFFFSFHNEGLTAKQCAEKMDSFQTRSDFSAEIPDEEALRFLSKVFIGRKGESLKCFTCSKVYTSSSGFWHHHKKCTLANPTDKSQEYKETPNMWLKVDKKDQQETLKSIVGTNYTCFSSECRKSFKTSEELITHLGRCIKPGYYSFKKRVNEFRQLSKKAKSIYVRDAMAANAGEINCLVCGKKYQSSYGAVYHIDRCQLENFTKPWKCYRCGFETAAAESESHLSICKKETELKVLGKLSTPNVEKSLLSLLQKDESDSTGSKKRRMITGGVPRSTARKDGTTLYRFRKSTVNREFNGIVTKRDQKNYEKACSSVFENWKIQSDSVPFCDRLKSILKSTWQFTKLDRNDQFYRILTRKSVTIITGKTVGLHSSVPPGIQVQSRKSVDLVTENCSINESNNDEDENDNSGYANVSYCGAPINSIKVAPGKTSDGEDIICVSTFSNETDFESDSSVLQFWKHRVDRKQSKMELWFLLHLPQHGAILSTTWLQKYDTSEPGLIGYIAICTSIGTVLIYRIDETSAPNKPADNSYDDVAVIVAEPHLTLRLSKKSSKISGESFLNATIKVEGEDVVIPMEINESTLPILRIAWSSHNGGETLAALTALGTLAIWNLNEELGNPRIIIQENWHSPPSDIAFLDVDNIVVGFKEKMVRVINIDTLEVKLEENTVKTAGCRVHTDPRILNSFITFQSEYNAYPYSNSTSITYISMNLMSMLLVFIPTGNTHQLMAWDVAMCPSNGTLLSCGIDGRLVASASGRLTENVKLSFFANRNVMSLKRRKVFNEKPDFHLKEVKAEGEISNSENKKEPLEESYVEHDDVCQKMWLELGFDQVFDPNRPELACRDQRIESLNCVDSTVDSRWPVTFTGGEAGLLFAVSSKLTVKEMDL